MTFSRQQAEFKALWKDIDTLQELSDRFVAAAEAQLENESSRTGGTQYELSEYLDFNKETINNLKNKDIIVVETEAQLISTINEALKKRNEKKTLR